MRVARDDFGSAIATTMLLLSANHYHSPCPVSSPRHPASLGTSLCRSRSACRLGSYHQLNQVSMSRWLENFKCENFIHILNQSQIKIINLLWMQISRCNAGGEIKSAADMSRSPREPWSGKRCRPCVVATHDVTRIATVLFQNKKVLIFILWFWYVWLFFWNCRWEISKELLVLLVVYSFPFI